MIVDNLDLVGMAVLPHETDPPLVIDPDAMLPLSVTSQCLESIAWRHPQVLKQRRSVQLSQFPEGYSLDVRRNRLGPLTSEELLGFRVPEALNHALIVTPSVTPVKTASHRCPTAAPGERFSGA